MLKLTENAEGGSHNLVLIFPAPVLQDDLKQFVLNFTFFLFNVDLFCCLFVIG